jgi:hypothetical protein
MAHMIEVAKSGRAKCRTCKQPIAKDELRFGEEVPDMFGGGGMTYQWHHLACAAKKKPGELKVAMDGFSGTIPNKAALESEMSEAVKHVKPSTYPYAERAPSGRSKCMQCDATIEKGDLRVAVEREVDTGSFTTKGPGYLHTGCAVEYTGDEELAAKIKANSPGLEKKDLEELDAGFGA